MGTLGVPILFHFLLFKLGPVAGLAQRRPLLVGSGPLGIALVVMAVGRLLHHKIEPVARVQTEGIVIRNLNGGRGGSGTVNAFPLRGISYVSSHGFSNRWRPAHKRVTAASGVAVKSRCGAVLFDDADLVGKDFFVLHAVSAGDGAIRPCAALSA